MLMAFSVVVPDEHILTVTDALLPWKKLETWKAREWVPECACFELGPKEAGAIRLELDATRAQPSVVLDSKPQVPQTGVVPHSRGVSLHRHAPAEQN